MKNYEQMDLWGSTDLEFAERTAIKLIKDFEPIALQRCPEHGYIVGYSGGKDSDCLVDLFIRSGVKFTVIHNHTTLDIPDTVRYIRKRFAEWTKQGISCEVHKPKESFWQLCVRHKILPMRTRRFCCSELKEYQPYPFAVYSFGVRRAESHDRAQRRNNIETRNTKKYDNVQHFHFDKSEEVRNTDMCYTNKYFIVNPMAQWSTETRDKYIVKHKLEVNPIYEKYGLSRCGCIMCPMASDKERRREAEMFPGYARTFRWLCDRIVKERNKIGKNDDEITGGGIVSKIPHTEMEQVNNFSTIICIGGDNYAAWRI